MMKLTVEFLLWFILVLIVICFVLILYLMAERKKQDKRKKQGEKYFEKTRHLWESYLLEDGFFSVTLIPRNKNEIIAVESILLSYIQNMYNEEVSGKIREFSKKYLIKYYQKEIKDKNWGRRMNALSKVIDFQLEELLPFFESSNRKNTTKEEQFLLLKIYSIFDIEKFFNIIFSSNDVLSEIEYKQLFSMLDENIHLKLFEKIGFLQLNAQYALIDTIAFKGNFEFVLILESLLNSTNSEIRIRSLKGIERMGLVKNLDLYFPFVTSQLWEERLMVAKVFQHVPLKFTHEHLIRLLDDSNWLVRTQAANTISDFPEGVQILNEFILTSFTEDSIKIAEEMLMKRLQVK